MGARARENSPRLPTISTPRAGMCAPTCARGCVRVLAPAYALVCACVRGSMLRVRIAISMPIALKVFSVAAAGGNSLHFVVFCPVLSRFVPVCPLAPILLYCRLPPRCGWRTKMQYHYPITLAVTQTDTMPYAGGMEKAHERQSTIRRRRDHR